MTRIILDTDRDEAYDALRSLWTVTDLLESRKVGLRQGVGFWFPGGPTFYAYRTKTGFTVRQTSQRTEQEPGQ